MIRFKQFIAEAFDSSYPYKELNNPYKELNNRYTFTDKDNFNYEVILKTNEHNMLIIDFAMKNRDGLYIVDPTGKSSNALKIYSTIGKIIEQYISNRDDITAIKFSAYSPKTHKVYDGLANLIARKLGGKVKHSGTIWIISL